MRLSLLAPAGTPFHVETRAVKRRRRVVVAVTAAVGATLTGLALQTPNDSTLFYPLAIALALTWTFGALLSGPLHLGRLGGRRSVVRPALVAVVAFGVFAAGQLVVRQVPALHDRVRDVIDRADANNVALILGVALLNAFAEELFFRGALFSSFGRHRPAVWTTLAYVTVTAASGNVMLTFAAAVMGTVFALERRSTRGILAPTVTHLLWSVLMIFFLPR